MQRHHCIAGALALVIATTGFAQATPPAQPDEPATTPQGTAPGQTQTAPGDASQQTPPATAPSGQPAAEQTQANQLAKATAADIKAGMSVYDEKGGLVGKVVSSDGKGVVVDTGNVKATIPLASFAKSDKGLVIGMTKDELEAAAKKSG